LGTGVFVETVKHLPASDRRQLAIEAISTEALTTSEIEGEIFGSVSVCISGLGSGPLVVGHTYYAARR
jgi:hypothetical protein